MQKYVALLRGINVSGQKKIPMVDLKSCLSNLGYQNIQTYIQSGNVVYQTLATDRQKMAVEMNAAIQTKFGFDVPILVLPQSNFQKVVVSNPYLLDSADTKSLYVAFLYDTLIPDRIEELKAFDTDKDQYTINEPYIYLKYAEGIGKSKMDNNLFERKLKIKATTRNWNTVMKLAEM